MVKKILFFVFAIFVALQSVAGNITGKVVDKSTKEPMEFVNITIRKVGESKQTLQGTVTDESGKFVLKAVPAGKYIVKASFVGYTATLQNVTATANNVSLATMELAPDTQVLNEVEVVGMKSQMRFDLDKKIFNVDQNIAAAGASASEILETIPSIEVDNDGEVSLRGNSSVTIWINGKPSGLTADNRAQVLEQLPAESIESVEVITNPSAKYDPEGTAGIINIVLKRTRQGGYFGSVNASVNTGKSLNVGGNINYNNDKWDTFFNIGYRRDRRYGDSYSYRTFSDGAYLNSNGHNDDTHGGTFVRAGATYHFNDRNELGVNGFGMLGIGKKDTWTDYESTQIGSFLNGRSSSKGKDGKGNGGGNVELSYKHTFAEDNELDASVSYSGWNHPAVTDFERQYVYADPSLNEHYFQTQDNHINVKNLQTKLDYENSFANGYKLQVGYEGRISKEDSPVKFFRNDDGQGEVPEVALWNRFIYKQNVQALYATYGGRVKDFSFQGGLRGEYWSTESQSPGYDPTTGDFEDLSKVAKYKFNKFALFPSVFLSYALPKDNELQVNYTRRIQRPRGGQLNPFCDTSDPTSIRYGNPELEPQYTNAFEVNYIKTWTNHMLSGSVYYRTTDNVIQFINFMNEGVMNSTSFNVSNSANAGGEIVLKNKLFKVLDLTTTVNLYYSKINGFVFYPLGEEGPVVRGDKNSNFSWNIRMMANVKLPWGLNFQANGGYNAKEIVAQGYRKPGYRLDAGLKKSFGNWSVSLNMRDILNSRKWQTITTTDGYTQDSKFKPGSRRLQVSVSYSFGNVKPKKKHHEGDGHDHGHGHDDEGSGYEDSHDEE